jgi:hypothetical protein
MHRTDCHYRWGWCDALFMAPPVWARLAKITGEQKYLRFMDQEFHATYDLLWDEEENLFWRDSSFFPKREKNGKKVFWARGNGWVIGGLALMIPDLPKNWEGRDFYVNLFKKMAASLKDLQRPDGTWSMGLLGSPEHYPAIETSGTSFITYALAWGINQGILDRSTYEPVVFKAWNALAECVSDEGLLGYVQPIGAAPGESYADKTEEYGIGAFLAAAAEIYKLVGGRDYDFSSPQIISAPNDQILEADADCQAVLPDYTSSVVATDAQSWPSELKIYQTPEPWGIISGASNQVTIEVTNKAGNSTQVSFNVKVEDSKIPEIACLENQTVDLDQGQTVYTVSGSKFDPVSMNDNCEIAYVSNDFNNSSTLEGAELPQGITTIVWNVEDESGNKAQCSFDVAINQSVGIEELKGYGISVYPNPTQGKIYVESTNNLIQQIIVSDFTGKMLIKKNSIQQQKERIDLSKYGNGVYFFNIITDEKRFIIKIIQVSQQFE